MALGHWLKDYIGPHGGGSGGSGGGGAEPLIVRAQSLVQDGNIITLTFDKTWQEVYDAIANGTPCYAGTRPVGGAGLVSLTIEDMKTPVMIPICEAFIDSGQYYIDTVVDGARFDAQTSPNTLLANVGNAGAE